MALPLLAITTATAQILGLDDAGRYADVQRREIYDRWIWCIGTHEALTDIVTEIYDRATEGSGGFDHSPRDKRILRTALARLKKQGWEPRA